MSKRGPATAGKGAAAAIAPKEPKSTPKPSGASDVRKKGADARGEELRRGVPPPGKSATSTKTKKKEADVPANSAEAATVRAQTTKTTTTAAPTKKTKASASVPPAAAGAAPRDLSQVDSAFMGDLQRRRLARDAALKKITAAKEERAKLLVKLEALEADILAQEDTVEHLDAEIKKGEQSYAEYLQITAHFLAAVWKRE